jgi:hypothetical protein
MGQKILYMFKHVLPLPRMNELIDEINKKDSIIEQDPLDSEVRILDWILYIVCSNEIKML